MLFSCGASQVKSVACRAHIPSRRPGVSAFRADCRLTSGEECEKADRKKTDANYDYPNWEALLLSKLATFGT